MSTSPETSSWYDPAKVIWLGGRAGQDDIAKKAAYTKVIASRATHLVREVKVRLPGHFDRYDPWPRHTTEELREATALADGEFELLEHFDIAVPKVDWHVVEEEVTRLVARVAIIDGIELVRLYGRPEDREYSRRVNSYNRSSAPGSRLSEMHLGQCLVGHLRATPLAEDALYMVDPEPIFFDTQ